MKDKEKQFKERVECGIAYCEDKPNKQIEEMAKDKLTKVILQSGGLTINMFGRGERIVRADVDKLANNLIESGLIIPKDSVVLSREEWEKLSSSHNIVFCDSKDCPDNLLCGCCEISKCPRNIPEYDKKLSANKHKLELFQKLCKERERADSWEDRYKLLEEELENKGKETAEKIFTEVLDLEQLKVIRDMGWETIYNSLCNEILELAKQFGVKIKE